MEESILLSIKKLIGGMAENETHFDSDILMHINTALSTLNQIGVGPEEGFMIYDASSLWSDLTGSNVKLEMVKTYIYLSVKIIFDPPTSSAVIDVMKNKIQELEWRLQVATDPIPTPVITEEE